MRVFFLIALAIVTTLGISGVASAKTVLCLISGGQHNTNHCTKIYRNKTTYLPPDMGVLIPDQATGPPPTSCAFPKDALAVIAGSMTGWSRRSHFTALELDSIPVVSVSRGDDGKIFLTHLVLWDETGKLIFHVDNNSYDVDPRYIVKNTDNNTISVATEKKPHTVLLWLHLTSNWLEVRGTFHVPGHSTFVVSETGITGPRTNLSNLCVGGDISIALMLMDNGVAIGLYSPS
jgi:hypothetical protein